MNRRILIIATAVGALALPATAQAHVTLQPERAPAGGFARLDVRVPNERDDGTRRVTVQMPPGFLFVSYEPEPGWRVQVTKRKLDRPVEMFGEQISEEVGRVTFTARGDRAVIAPGQFRDFGLSVGVPDGKPGAKLTFKALQTYEGGEVVRWIGPPDTDEPAPQVTLVAGEEEGDGGDAQADGAAAEGDGKGDEDDEGDTLALVALIVGGLGLLAGAAALLTRRRG